MGSWLGSGQRGGGECHGTGSRTDDGGPVQPSVRDGRDGTMGRGGGGRARGAVWCLPAASCRMGGKGTASSVASPVSHPGNEPATEAGIIYTAVTATATTGFILPTCLRTPAERKKRPAQQRITAWKRCTRHPLPVHAFPFAGTTGCMPCSERCGNSLACAETSGTRLAYVRLQATTADPSMVHDRHLPGELR